MSIDVEVFVKVLSSTTVYFVVVSIQLGTCTILTNEL